jgi:hypothetical protein
MSTCFVAPTIANEDRTAVYEFANGSISLINNRSFKSPAKNEIEAEKIVEEHAPKFLQSPISKIERREFSIGTHYPSIARPIYAKLRLKNPNFKNDEELLARAKREIGVLADDLEECFDVCSPHIKNLEVFGTWFESTILFACIGIENMFAKVLRDNKIPPIGSTYNTTDFVRLLHHLRLNEYEAQLSRYPWLDPFTPFKDWTQKQPTQSLVWFHAYNKLKHSKDVSYHFGTMRNAINACLAYWIVLHAIFGSVLDTRAFQSEVGDFYISSTPIWSLDQYYFEAEDQVWTPQHLVI